MRKEGRKEEGGNEGRKPSLAVLQTISNIKANNNRSEISLRGPVEGNTMDDKDKTQQHEEEKAAEERQKQRIAQNLELFRRSSLGNMSSKYQIRN